MKVYNLVPRFDATKTVVAVFVVAVSTTFLSNMAAALSVSSELHTVGVLQAQKAGSQNFGCPLAVRHEVHVAETTLIGSASVPMHVITEPLGM